jgi:Transposase DNA-binding/Transposase Tn5 dimerisation domain
MREAGPSSWAFEEFGGARIADARWRRRLVSMAGRAARRPAGRVTETFVRSGERQGAYGLLESESVSADEVGQAMFEACARRSADEAFVYCPIDGTSLSLADRERSKGFGPVGSRANGGRGLKVMNAMVLSADGVPLGVSSQRYWTRAERRRGKHRDKLRPEQKETQHWLDAIKQTREVMAEHAPSTRCWFQLDREGDAWPMLKEAGLGQHWFTIRACRNRWARLPDGQRTYLWSLLEQQPVKTTYLMEVRAAGKRKARKANMVVRACKVTLDIRDKRTNGRSQIELNVVQAMEQGTTPVGEKPIQWTLLTNRPIEIMKDITDVIVGYSMRWRIEELHRTWKSGACSVEENQLRSAGAAIKWAIILIAVAARIERIKQLSREQPHLPATDEFSPAEIKAAALLYFGKAGKTKVNPAATPTIAEVTLWIAFLGGYTGKTSSGGPPGTITIARGLQSVRAAAQALEALSSD